MWLVAGCAAICRSASSSTSLSSGGRICSIRRIWARGSHDQADLLAPRAPKSRLLNRAREVSDHAQRAALYRDAIEKFAFARRNIVYLYHQNYIVAFPKNFKGYKGVPDGLIRIKGTAWN